MPRFFDRHLRTAIAIDLFRPFDRQAYGIARALSA